MEFTRKGFPKRDQNAQHRKGNFEKGLAPQNSNKLQRISYDLTTTDTAIRSKRRTNSEVVTVSGAARGKPGLVRGKIEVVNNGHKQPKGIVDPDRVPTPRASDVAQLQEKTEAETKLCRASRAIA